MYRNPVRIAVRLIRLWRVYAWMDSLWVARSLSSFLIYYLADLILNLSAATAILLLAERFSGIGGWSKMQILFMLGYATVVTGVLDLFFGYNVMHISRRLGRGQLDHTLIQPQPLWMSLVTEGFVPAEASGTLIVGVALIGWAGVRTSVAWGPGRLALLLVNLVSSILIVWSYTYIWGSLAFWAPRAAEEINTSTIRLLQQLKAFPLDGVPGPLMFGLMTGVPVGFIAWYPTRVLLGLNQAPAAVWVTPMAAGCSFALALAVFRQGLLHYGRTGSHRYLGLGHRG
jgi:ABC-2 type transport system permease protein